MTSQKSDRTALLLILATALALRVAAALIHPSTFPDSKDYDALARTIVEGRTYEVNGLFATRMPGYPIFVAGIYAVFGYHQLPVLLVQSLLSTLTVYLTYLLAKNVGGTAFRLPLIAAALAALDPLSIAFSASMLTETPFTTVLLAALLLSLKLLRRPSLIFWLSVAALWVAAVQLRPAVYWCIVPIALLLIFFARKCRHRTFHVAGLIIVLLLVEASLVPWHQRNDAHFASDFHADNSTRFRFTTLEGISLYEAVYPEATGGPRQDVIPVPPEIQRRNEAQRNQEWNLRAWQFIKADPGRIAKLAFVKVGRTWSPVLNASEFQGNRLLQFALALWHIPLFALATIAIVRRTLPISAKLLVLTPVLYFTAVHALFLGSVRYRVPLAPIICLLAAAGLLSLLTRKAPKPTQQKEV